jgi:hypothetical protein
MVAHRRKNRIQPNRSPTLFPDNPRLYEIAHVDAFEWLEQAQPGSVHAVVTDPPYGLLEYTPRELQKMANGRGGVWRIPP